MYLKCRSCLPIATDTGRMRSAAKPVMPSPGRRCTRPIASGGKPTLPRIVKRRPSSRCPRARRCWRRSRARCRRRPRTSTSAPPRAGGPRRRARSAGRCRPAPVAGAVNLKPKVPVFALAIPLQDKAVDCFRRFSDMKIVCARTPVELTGSLLGGFLSEPDGDGGRALDALLAAPGRRRSPRRRRGSAGRGPTAGCPSAPGCRASDRARPAGCAPRVTAPLPPG